MERALGEAVTGVQFGEVVFAKRVRCQARENRE